MREPSDFVSFTHAHGKDQLTVYRSGVGPGVIIMSEVPGVSAEVVRFARMVREAGFTVYLPRLFGDVGEPTTMLGRAVALAGLCVSRTFWLLAERRASPIVDWLRSLGRRVRDEAGGVGVLGMCVTGNFGLTMALDPWVLAPVLAAPSLPMPLTRRKSAAVHASPATLERLRQRTAVEDYKVLGLRFEGDRLCRAERFQTLVRELGPGFESIVLPDEASGAKNEPVHSMLTTGLIDRPGEPTRAAVDRVIEFFHERLTDRSGLVVKSDVSV